MGYEPSYNQPISYSVIPKEDHGKFKEYSVIHTDRSLNLMSDPYQEVMRDLNRLLKVTYNADKVAIIPGYVCSLGVKNAPCTQFLCMWRMCVTLRSKWRVSRRITRVTN
jgi:hypothetical protein